MSSRTFEKTIQICMLFVLTISLAWAATFLKHDNLSGSYFLSACAFISWVGMCVHIATWNQR